MKEQRLAVGLEGLWFYDRVDRSGISSWRFSLITIAVSISIHIGLFFLLPSIAESKSASVMDDSDMFIFYLLMGFIASLYFFSPLVILRFIQFDLEDNLPNDEVLIVSRDILKPSLKEYLKGAIGVLVSAGILFEVLVWNLFDFHLLSVEMLEQPVSVTTFFYVVAPIQAFFGCVTFASIGHMGSYLVKVSQAIPINLLALERYACLATPAAIFFSGSSLILMSGSLAAQFLGDGFSEGFVRFLFGFGILMLIILMLFLIPIWLVRNRIAKRITFEKSLVQRALEGNRSVLDESTQFPAGGDRSEADLLSRMIFLDGLSEWPIGQNLQRVVIFGLLPPIAWALAAVIENTLY